MSNTLWFLLCFLFGAGATWFLLVIGVRWYMAWLIPQLPWLIYGFVKVMVT